MRSVEGYCVKCRSSRVMKNAKGKSFTVKGKKRFAVQGVCSSCGTKMTRFLSEAY